uniref:Fibroblast growth factor receptor-like 1 n=2 Tax=Salarias fasciatus TaxID=181472 RepID=A0A672G196_SALFA
MSAAAVRGPPRVSERVTHRQSVRLGRTIKLPCPVEGDPPPLIMWTKDGRNIHSGWTRFRVLLEALRIKEVETEDAGTYICKATNGFGSVNINYTLIVIDDSSSRNGAGSSSSGSENAPELAGKLVRPRFTQPAKMRKRVIARPVGSSVRLKCTASGNPRPDIVWLKDSRPLVDNDSGAAGEAKKKRWTLSLKNLTPEHSGKYTCHVSNRAGEINATYKVEVIQRTNSKPILTGTHPVNTTVDYGGTTSFQCKVRSDVKPVIQWLKRVEPGDENKFNSTIEVGDHRFVVLPTGEVWSRPDGSYLNKLLITRAKEEDAGMYICLGANTMGYSFRSAYLTVLPDRKPPPVPVPTATSPGLPWPVIIGIPAGVAFIFGTALLWFCRSKRTCSSSSSSSSSTSSSSSSSSALPAAQRLPAASRDRGAQPAGGDKDHLSYEDYIAHQQLLLAQGGGGGATALAPKVYPKIYTDIHTHTHSHVDGKVHQHQHIHYQC